MNRKEAEAIRKLEEKFGRIIPLTQLEKVMDKKQLEELQKRGEIFKPIANFIQRTSLEEKEAIESDMTNDNSKDNDMITLTPREITIEMMINEIYDGQREMKKLLEQIQEKLK